MLPYLIYILLTLSFSIFFDGRDFGPGKKIAYALTCLYLILLSGLRYAVGGDTQSYMEDFEYMPTMTQEWSEYIQYSLQDRGYMPMWSLMNLLCKYIFDSFYAFQIIHAAIVNILVFYVFKKFTKHIFLCALFYGLSGQFFNFNTEVLREGIAIALCATAMFEYTQGKKTIFYLFVLAGISFHISASIVLLFPFVRVKDITGRTLIYAFLISFVLWILSDLIMTYVPYFLFGNAATTSKVVSYSNWRSTIFGFMITAIQYIVVQAGIMYFAKERISEDDERRQVIIHCFGFYLIMAVLSCSFAGFSRFMNYAILFFIILLAEFIYNLGRQLQVLGLTKMVLLSGLLYFWVSFYALYWPDNNRYHYEFFIPYTSINDEDEDISYRISMYQEATTRQKTFDNTRQ